MGFSSRGCLWSTRENALKLLAASRAVLGLPDQKCSSWLWEWHYQIAIKYSLGLKLTSYMKPKNRLKTYCHPYIGSYTLGSSLFEHSLPDVMVLNFASGEITWRELFRSDSVFVWCCFPLFLFFSCTLFTLEWGLVWLCKWLKLHFLSLTRSLLCAVFHPFFLWLFPL